MDITEDEAKKILNFLAKKIGYDSFVLCNGNLRLFKGNYFMSLFLVDGVLTLKIMQCSLKNASYYDVLAEILRNSSEGFKIETLDDEMFLAPATSLEQILIEMDLEKN